jgi:hypothetical protein
MITSRFGYLSGVTFDKHGHHFNLNPFSVSELHIFVGVDVERHRPSLLVVVWLDPRWRRRSGKLVLFTNLHIFK